MTTSIASLLSDDALWEGIGRRHPDTLAEALRRHREVAFALARTITRNSVSAMLERSSDRSRRHQPPTGRNVAPPT